MSLTDLIWLATACYALHVLEERTIDRDRSGDCRSDFLLEQDLSRKPVPAFRDQALCHANLSEEALDFRS
jgi:hypothetical protein